MTITSVNVTLNYATATNPPVMQLIWPVNGTYLSGESFHVRGWIKDETASIKAQIVEGGITNEFAGLVERNGVFWVEGVPLAGGTNLVTLVAEDAAGNLSSTNLSVVKSSVTVTITSMPEGEALYEPFGTVAGTVTDPTYNVSVNGVAATVDEYGDWLAEDVPLFGRGTAIFDVVATPSGGGSAPVAVSMAMEMPARIVVVEHTLGKSVSRSSPASFHNFERIKGYSASLKPGTGDDWANTLFGTTTDRNDYTGGWDLTIYQWTATNRSTHVESSSSGEWNSTNIVESYAEITGVPDKDARELGWVGGPGGGGAYPPTYLHHYYARGVRYEWSYPDGGRAKATVSARTEMKLYTGGKAGIKRKSLIHINAWAEQYGRPADGPWLHTPTENVPSTRIKVLGWWLFGRHLDPSGDLYLALPDNAVKNLNLRVPGAKHYGAWATATKLRLELTSVTFDGTAGAIEKDDNTGPYSVPHWLTNDTTGVVTSHPVLYVSGSEVQANTEFKVIGDGSFPVIVKGKVSGGGTSLTLWGTNDGPMAPACNFYVYPDEPLTASRVDFYNPMKIKWQYSHRSKLDFLDAGTSTNQVYVTLASPTTANLYHTVVHLACSEPGASTPAQAAANTWSLFTGKAVKTWDQQPLLYWGGGAATATDTAGLLAQRNGQCGSWAELLIDSIGVNGVGPVQKVYLTPIYENDPGTIAALVDPRGTMLVKNWNFQTGTAPSALWPFTHRTGEFGDSSGASGQNNPNPPGGFLNHFIVKYDSEYYDPSYGNGPFTSQELWEDASIDGYFKVFFYSGADFGTAKRNTSGVEMQFIPLP